MSDTYIYQLLGRTATHEHEYQGQKLRHSHPGGDQAHGYFEHPEDGFPAEPTQSGTPVADALAKVDKAQNGFTCACDLGTVDADRVTRQVMSNSEAAHVAAELKALRVLAEAVRLSLTAFSEGDVRTLAVTALDLLAEASLSPDLTGRQAEVLVKARELFGEK